MANLDFYAAADDLRELFRFLFGETNIVVYESSSERNLPVRQFRSLPALEEVIALGNYRAAYLQLWSPSVMVEPVIRRIDMAGLPQSPQRFGQIRFVLIMHRRDCGRVCRRAELTHDTRPA